MPSLFVWRDEQSQAKVVVTWESGYGGIGKLFTLPNGVALAADWTGDNSGPNSNFGNLEQLRKANLGAHVHISSFSAFFDEANKPENKRGLPVVTAEIGKCWPARCGLLTRHSLSFFLLFFHSSSSASPRGRKTSESGTMHQLSVRTHRLCAVHLLLLLLLLQGTPGSTACHRTHSRTRSSVRSGGLGTSASGP